MRRLIVPKSIIAKNALINYLNLVIHTRASIRDITISRQNYQYVHHYLHHL